MLFDRKDVERNIRWLVANGSPAVRYLTHRHLLSRGADSGEMQGLRAEVEECAEAREVFSKQRPDGSWYAGGSWANKPHYMPKGGYSAYTPKYVTAVWIVGILGRMGFTVQDPRVLKACEYMLSFQWPNGWFDRFKVEHKEGAQCYAGEVPDNFPCDQSAYLSAFGSVGMGKDPRLTRTYDLLLGWQREDGGWISRKHKEERNWYRSCPASSFGAARALYYSGRPEHAEPLKRGLEFQVWHWSLKSDEEMRHFFYHGHRTVDELLMLSEYGVALDSHPVRTILDWLMGMYHRREGFFRYEGKPVSKYRLAEDGATPQVAKYMLYHLIEDDWLTYYMTRIAANLACAEGGRS